MTHLTERTYTQLLAGTLPRDEARDLARHLDAGCDACEALLAAREGADALDGRVDGALAALSRRPAEGDDLEFHRILRRLDAQGRARPGFVRRAGVRLVAVAAVLAIAGAAAMVLQARSGAPPAWDGEKGAASQAAPVRLRFLVVSRDPGGATALEKGRSGQTVAPVASLEFEVELARAAEVALVRVAGRGAPEVFFREPLAAGRSTISVGTRPAAYPLSGLAGPQRFLAIASPGRLDPARLERVAAALAAPARVASDLPALEGLSVDAVEVTVR